MSLTDVSLKLFLILFISFFSSALIQFSWLCPSLCVSSTKPVWDVWRSSSHLHEHWTPLAVSVLQPDSQFDSQCGSSQLCSTTGGCRFSHYDNFQTFTNRRWDWVTHPDNLISIVTHPKAIFIFCMFSTPNIQKLVVHPHTLFSPSPLFIYTVYFSLLGFTLKGKLTFYGLAENYKSRKTFLFFHPVF